MSTSDSTSKPPPILIEHRWRLTELRASVVKVYPGEGAKLITHTVEAADPRVATFSHLVAILLATWGPDTDLRVERVITEDEAELIASHLRRMPHYCEGCRTTVRLVSNVLDVLLCNACWRWWHGEVETAKRDALGRLLREGRPKEPDHDRPPG